MTAYFVLAPGAVWLIMPLAHDSVKGQLQDVFKKKRK